MKKNLFIYPMTLVLLCLIGLNASAQQKAQAALPQLGKSPLKDVVKAMTLEEKAKLVVGMGFKMPGMPRPTEKQMKEGIDVGGFKLPPSDEDAYNIPTNEGRYRCRWI